MARRFAIVSPNFYPRVCGVGDYSVHFGVELQRRGHEVKVFSRQPTSENPMAPGLEVHGVAGQLPMVIAQRVAASIRAFRPTDVLLQYTSQMAGDMLGASGARRPSGSPNKRGARARGSR